MTKQNIQEEVEKKIKTAYQEIKSIRNSEEIQKMIDNADERVEDLEAQKDEIDTFYEELLSASEDTAQEYKDKFDRQYQSFTEEVDKIKSLAS